MRAFNCEKKSSDDSWDREDIIAAVHKKGWTLRQLSFFHGYSNGGTLKNALDRPWLRGEKLIADAIGVPAEKIWPARYERRDKRNSYKRKGL